MEIKTEFKKQVDFIRKSLAFIGEPSRIEDIAKGMGYSRGYLSVLLNNPDTITQEHLNTLKNSYRWIYATDKPINVQKKNNTEVLGEFYEEMVRIKARLNVLEQMVDLSAHNQTGRSIAIVSTERQRAVKMEINRLLDELRSVTSS